MDHRRCIAPPTMATDRLSGLPDDLLRRILYFAPAREGAATAVLSRRWPGLWATSGAVNLDTRSYDRAHGRDLSFEKRESFLAGAAAALARAQGPVRRLAVDVVAENPFQIYNFLHAPDYYTTEEYSMLAGVLADPAAQHVQELRLRVGAAGDAHGSIKYRLAGEAHGIEYRLGFGALPSRELRLLQITSCTDLAPPPPAAAFPLLAKLVLLGCTTSLGGLQGMIDAAPLLAVLHLEHTRLTGALQVVAETDDGAQILVGRYRLRSPTVTSLVLAEGGWPESSEASVKLDMPMLRCFKYHGLIHRFSLKPKPPDMTRADLHFIDDDCFHEHQQMHQRRKAFWRFVRNFDNAKFLKLELELEHIAVVAEKSRKVVQQPRAP